MKVGRLFDTIIWQMNITHELSLYPLTLKHTLGHMDGGKELIAASNIQEEQNVLAQAAVDMNANAGRGCRGGVLGILSRPNEQGSVKTGRVKTLTGFSRSWINHNKKKAVRCFGSINKSGASCQPLCKKRKESKPDPMLVQGVPLL